MKMDRRLPMSFTSAPISLHFLEQSSTTWGLLRRGPILGSPFASSQQSMNIYRLLHWLQITIMRTNIWDTRIQLGDNSLQLAEQRLSSWFLNRRHRSIHELDQDGPHIPEDFWNFSLLQPPPGRFGQLRVSKELLMSQFNKHVVALLNDSNIT